MPLKLPVFSRVAEEDVADAPKGNWLEGIRGPLNDVMSTVRDLLGGGITFVQNVDCEIKDIDILVPDPWIYPTPENDWHQDTPGGVPLRYMKHPDGSVEWQGDLIDGSSVVVLSSGVVKPAYTPDYDLRFPSVNGLVFDFVTIFADGGLSAHAGTDSSFNFRYMAEDPTPYSSSAFPIFVSTKYSKKPLAVICVSIEDITDTDPKKLGCAMQLDWDYISVKGTPSIQIKNICGLPYNRKYRLKLLIVGE